ncbi:hypothetical protein P3T18_001898 [Paraburkholderia sp. GAS199]
MTPRCEDRSISVSQIAKAPRRSRWLQASDGSRLHRVALIIGAWGRVGQLGSSRAISIKRTCASRTAYVSVFLCVECVDESFMSENGFGGQNSAVFRAGF